MRALIVGGCGFVGMNIAEALLRRGDDVVLLDVNPLSRAASRAFEQLSGTYSVEQMDVCVAPSIAGVFTNHNIDTNQHRREKGNFGIIHDYSYDKINQ